MGWRLTPCEFRTLSAALTLLAAALAASPAIAGDAADELQRQADRVIGVLADRSTAAVERQREIRTIVTEVFDFDEASRRTLGRAWAERTPEERASFKALFVDLLDRAYLRRLDGWMGSASWWATSWSTRTVRPCAPRSWPVTATGRRWSTSCGAPTTAAGASSTSTWAAPASSATIAPSSPGSCRPVGSPPDGKLQAKVASLQP
jgi:hypothetical protein